MTKTIPLLFLLLLQAIAAYGQGDTEATLLLDLKKTRADYEVARQKFQNDTKLYSEKAISANDFNRSRNELLSKEVDYQKLILRLISQQSYITVEKAVKYQDAKGERKVKLTLKSALEGNEEYLSQFKEHFDVFTPEMRSGKIYNIYISLVDNATKTIISSPYEYRVPAIALGELATADFELLKDAEDLTVSLNYNNRKDEKNIYLKKDASVNVIDISSMQFSQEADLSSKATYDLTLERFSTADDVYRLEVIDLPRQISYDFLDGESKVTQIKFAQGMNVKKLSLQVYLPERDDEQVVIDRPLTFAVQTVGAADGVKAGAESLEIIPRGKGRIEVRANNLYHETTPGKAVVMEVKVRNAGSRRMDNIRLTTEKPLGWETTIAPDLLPSLEPEKEATVQITILPPSEGGVGAQEIKIKTEAMADNRKVSTEDKTVRIQVNAPTSIFGTLALILLLIAFIGGIVWFGMKLSRR